MKKNNLLLIASLIYLLTAIVFLLFIDKGAVEYPAGGCGSSQSCGGIVVQIFILELVVYGIPAWVTFIYLIINKIKNRRKK